jgi:hypothetical protein
VQAGQEFEVADEMARELLTLGYVKHAADPAVAYETQAIIPEEAPTVAARRPFRHVSVHNEKQAAVASPRDSVIPRPDVPAEGDADRRGRRRRS